MKIDRLYSELEKSGLKGRVVSIRRLADIERDIKGCKAQNLFDKEFYRERLEFFDYQSPDATFSCKSIIIAARPRPQTRVTFSWGGKVLSLILPPTYWNYQNIAIQTTHQLNEILAPAGYHVTLASLPLKTLAVHSQLATYGRNNITYVDGMGSFFQLIACYSDLPCEDDEWQEARMMERCHKCQACLRKCPTHAITEERFLLHAERCIVFHNERGVDHKMPDWLDLSSHDCLFGCMYCQRYCPEDTGFMKWFDGNEEFTESETAWLLQGQVKDSMPAGVAEKLGRLSLSEDIEVISRNLRILYQVNQ